MMDLLLFLTTIVYTGALALLHGARYFEENTGFKAWPLPAAGVFLLHDPAGIEDVALAALALAICVLLGWTAFTAGRAAYAADAEMEAQRRQVATRIFKIGGKNE